MEETAHAHHASIDRIAGNATQFYHINKILATTDDIALKNTPTRCSFCCLPFIYM